MNLWERIGSVIWSEWFWFPDNATWKSLENKPGSGVYYPQTSDLLYSFGIAISLYIIRLLYEKVVVAPFGVYCGIKTDRPRRAPQNDVLEREYKHKRQPDFSQLQLGLKKHGVLQKRDMAASIYQVPRIYAKRTDMEVRQVERWFRLRRNQDRPSPMKKFTETGWRFTYYFGIWIYGLLVLYDDVTPGIFWYYIIELGFYLSLMFSQFLDVKRKAAKLAKYAKAHRLCDILFAVFAIVWFITRLLLILKASWILSVEIVGFFPSLYFFNGWLCILLVLHFYWFSLICRVAYDALTKSSEVDDVRSESEEPVSDETENSHMNGNCIKAQNDNAMGNHVDVGNNSVSNHNHTKAG
ncbi:CERS5-like protein [Mya arenaria]|uniref:CERS5-like protein n=1 Tax=Mya arenaria TaxID=6604 RepID=A0ABY7DCM1_MYAAR|nr:CERS5-like protein [Mya arenaria]